MIALVVTVTEEGSSRTERLAFMKSPVRIGRGELNDLALQEPFVSTYHGLIQFDEHEARYVDLGSLNGSLLDGETVQKNAPALLGPGAEVRIGTFCLTFERRSHPEHLVPPRHMTAFEMKAASSVRLISDDSGGALPVAPSEEAAGGPASLDAAIAAGEALAGAMVDLDLYYTSYRGTWEHLRAALERLVAGLEGPARQAALERMGARYPALMTEPQFLTLLGMAGTAPSSRAGPPRPPPAGISPIRGPGADALLQLRTFCESYLPVTPDLATSAEIQTVLGRLAAGFEAFGRSFVELRQGYEEFGKEMGVRTVHGEGALYRARDARQLLAYVLDPRGEGRDGELQRAFAEFMIHQVALLRGVVEGAQALVAQLSPAAISTRVRQSAWRSRAPALWKAYEERFHEIADEDRAVSAILFGKEFARAYSAMVGQQAPEGEPDGEGPTRFDPERQPEHESEPEPEPER
ncbi:MAG: hypothetical protein A2V77_20620 [Anaeromyxobacter sp. RBG_16_69_14]|nr:MAG: hypothetical protein A2V77_20620 [Anaeromyxobacter sp. RBG_16_69_14]